MPTIKIVPFPGVPGPDGPQGPRGYQGDTGLTGPAGAAGASAYEIAVDNGFEGTEQEWLDSLGDGGTADIADFVFTTSFQEGNDPGDDTSTMTVHNHDMEIRTTRDDAPEGSEGPYDADISISSADDIWIEANDEIRIAASNSQVDIEAINDSVYITSYGSREDGGSGNTWEFGEGGGLKFPDGTIQTTAYIAPETDVIPLADFLTYAEGRSHLPALNTNFGWNSDGAYFGPTAGEGEGSSYPIFTDFTINETTPVRVQLEVVVAEDCADAGIAFYVDGTTPEWFWGSANATRIAAQFDCLNAELSGINSFTGLGENLPLTGPGTYLVIINYTPGEGVVFDYGTQFNQLGSLSLAESLPTGNYRIGFASDNDGNDVATRRTYIKNLTITLSPETMDEVIYTDTLMNGNSAAPITTIADLVIPVAVKDENDDDFITITRTSTGTARIDAPQDDLSLRSAADITLFAGTDGPGNVYIGWGDAEYTPDSPNRVATIGDIEGVHGNFTFDESTLRVSSGDMTLEANEGDGAIAAQIKVDAGYIPIEIAAYDQDSSSFYEGDWSTAEWQSDGGNGGQIVLTGITSINDFLNTSFTNAEFQKININNEFTYPYNGGSYGGGSATLYVSTGPEGGTPVTITSLQFRWSDKSGIIIDQDDSQMTIASRNMELDIFTTDSNDLRISSSDDLDLRAEDDITFSTDTDGTERYWSMDSEGKFNLPGQGYIENPVDSSGDGNGYDTIKIVPDDDREQYDQYLVIDPTDPNHIHIRAGGAQDYSNAELILGGERVHVKVADASGNVEIQAKKEDLSWTYQNIDPAGGVVFVVDSDTAEPDFGDFMIVNGVKYVISSVTRDLGNTSYETTPSFTFGYNEYYTFKRDMGEWSWRFDEGGYISGPNEGGIFVYDIERNDGGDLFVTASEGARVVLSGTSGEYLNSPNDANNQIATIGDVSNATPVETSFAVNGGSLGTQPTFNGAPLFTGSYVKHGPMVHFQIQVDMDNITSFGTGQYYVDLPFDAKYGYQFKEGCLHDISASNQYAIGGHVAVGTNRLYLTYTGSNGQDEVFDHDSPVTLNVADNFHISGTYIAD
jgi:hypothetical protein